MAQTQPEHYVTVGTERLHMTYDNTTIRLFGNMMLNHTYHETDDDRFVIVYSDELLDTLHEEGFPQYSRMDNPEWAIHLLVTNDDGASFEIEL